MTFIMKEVFIMNFGGFLFNPHYLHTLLHDVIKTHYEPPKIIMNTSFIMKVIMTLIVFQCTPPQPDDRPGRCSKGTRRTTRSS